MLADRISRPFDVSPRHPQRYNSAPQSHPLRHDYSMAAVEASGACSPTPSIESSIRHMRPRSRSLTLRTGYSVQHTTEAPMTTLDETTTNQDERTKITVVSDFI
ncbi:MAG: hypothetical protein HOH95_12095 [Dehalococcoidia bacterium]|jgi:hypothetical protein|nr:hypothetical protein [Dehalococcoidia bacterium]